MVGTVQAGGCPQSAIDPFADDFLADPFPALAALREAGPVVRLDRYGVYAVARHREVQAVLRDPARFSSAAGVGILNAKRDTPWRKPSILLEVDPPVHTANRRVVARAVSPPAMASLQGVFVAHAEELADRLADRRSFDAVADLAEVFPTEVFPAAFGLRQSDREKLLAYGAMVFNGHGPRNHLFEASMAGAEKVIEWVTAQCSRSALRPDGLGMQIYGAVDAGEVGEEEAALLVRSFLSAGIDTTVNAIALGVRDFARFPDQWDAVRAEPSLARQAFEEVVRYESPVIGFFRTTEDEVELGGTVIPSGEKVLVFYAGANRDPERWEEADCFDVHRRTAGHMGYGTGIHNCVGQAIARMEGEALFGAFSRRVARWHVAGTTRPRLNNTLRGLDSLPVRVEPV